MFIDIDNHISARYIFKHDLGSFYWRVTQRKIDSFLLTVSSTPSYNS